MALGPAAPGAGPAFGFRWLTGSFLVATFFNNFLPSNIGGDVIRIADTASAAGSKTLATTVVLIDRGIGLLGLVLLAALGATLARRCWTTAADGWVRGSCGWPSPAPSWSPHRCC